jgi:beta-N-acetylhexosaminidase
MKKLLLALVFLAYNFTIQAQLKPRFLRETNQRWVDSVFNKLSPDERIAQLIMVAAVSDTKRAIIDTTFSRPAVVKEYINKYKIGGVIFFQGSPMKQAILTNEYQKMSKVPLLVAIDGEWGLNMRLDSTVRFPYQMTLGAIQGNIDGIYDMGKEMARHCKRLGIHVNFAPTVDINSNPNNPVINFRSFGENRDDVFEKSFHYMRGMQDGGILSSIKHFPGHGDTEADSHYGLPLIKHNKKHLEENELYPFKKLIKAGADGVMVAHLSIPALDTIQNQPSTLSKKIVTDLLKKELGFKGMIYSDAMNMQGLTKYYKDGNGEVQALVAGLEVLEFVPDIPKAIAAIKKAVAEGKIPQSDVDERCKKVLASKSWAGLDKYKPIDLVNLTKDLNPISAEVTNRKLYAKALTIIKDNNNQLPVNDLSQRIASVSIDAEEKTPFQSMLENYTNVSHFRISKNASDAAIIAVKEKIKDFDLVLIALHQDNIRPGRNFGLTPVNIKATKLLLEHKNASLTIFGNPYSINKLEGLQNAKSILMAYQETNLTEEVAAQAIMGALPFEGKLPVTINAEFKVTKGINKPSLNRLQYSNPELLGIDSQLLSRRVDSVVNQALSQQATPGAVVQIAKDGVVIFKKAYGKQTYDADAKPVQLSNLYDFASITKISTSALGLMKMVGENKINLDGKLGDYYAPFKNSTKENMILRELLTHKAGLKAWIPFWMNCIDSVKTVLVSPKFKEKYSTTYKIKLAEKLFNKNKYNQRILTAIKTDKTLWTDCLNTNIIWKANTLSKDSSEAFSVKINDGLFLHKNYRQAIFDAIKDSPVAEKKDYVYSDLGFYLYPEIISSITGENWETYLKKTYQKIGANSLTYNPLRFTDKSNIVPTEVDTLFRHGLIHGRVHDEGAALLNGYSGHAGLFGNANDLMKLMYLYQQKGKAANEQLLKKELVEEFTKYQYEGNNRGIAFEKPTKNRSNTAPSCSDESYGHSGFTGTYTWVEPQLNLVFVMLTNRVNTTRDNRKIINLNTRTQVLEQVYKTILKK